MSKHGTLKALAWAAFAVVMAGCTVGEGSGWVKSDQLYIENCWNGEFDLQPTFFGANPYREESLFIRVQRGDNWQEVSDGLTVLVTDVKRIRKELIGTPIAVGLPPGVSPPGVPITENPEPPLVSLALYLHRTCHTENGTIYSVRGEITFDSLFSGDPNEHRSEDRFTEARFDNVVFADPRDRAADAVTRQSVVSGAFKFFFQRGQPAQPFP
jgi:hypothetical protein